MIDAQRFNFIEGFDAFGVPDALPQLNLALTYLRSSSTSFCMEFIGRCSVIVREDEFFSGI